MRNLLKLKNSVNYKSIAVHHFHKGNNDDKKSFDVIEYVLIKC